jgi:small conductance mechanosensitive channel
MPFTGFWMTAPHPLGRLAAVSGLVVLLLSALVGVPPSPAFGQETTATSGAGSAPSDAEINRLIDVIEDPAEREQFLEYLRTFKAVEEQRQAENNFGSIALDAASVQMERISDGIRALANTLSDLPEVWAWLGSQVGDSDAQDIWLEIALKLATILAAAILTRWIVRALIAKPRRLLRPTERDRFWVAIPMQLGRLVLALVLPAAILGVTFAVISVLQAREITRYVVMAIVNAYFIVAIVVAILREIMAPHSVLVRLVQISEENAEYIIVWARRLATVGIYGYFAAQVALLLGLPVGAYQVLLRLVGLVFGGLAVVLILQVRHDIAQKIRGRHDAVSGFRTGLAGVWHILAIVYVIALYAVWALAIEDGFQALLRATLLTILLIAMGQLLLFVATKFASRGFSLSPDVKARLPGLEARANRYLPILRRFLKIVILLAMAFSVLEVWGFGTLAWLGTEAGVGLVNTVSMIVLVTLVALVVSEMFSLMVERYLKRLDERRVSANRARTLLPLLRTAFRSVLVVLVVLVILSEIGVDIAPLLAGAGVIGLAIGFGAQKLVQDVITGFFILVEDSVSVGDYVEAGGHGGTVENMSIRSIQMRDVDGVVHTVPFSVVDTVKNFSKDYSYALLDIGVAYRENTDEVTEIIRSVGEEMVNDSSVKDSIIGRMEIFGVNELGDSAVIVRARFKTRPMLQWAVKREFFRRIKFAFDAKGIELPFPHQTIYFGDDKSGHVPPANIRIVGSKAEVAPAPVQAPAADEPSAAASSVPGNGQD